MATAFPEKAITTQFLAIKNDTLAGLLILRVPKSNYEWRIMNYESSCYENLALTKAMQILTDLNTKLLKTVNVKVHQSNDNRKVSLEIAKVLKDSGEGRLFLLQAGARKQ
jgi:hypothetical protein